ncbi:MAG: hypothetical protein KY428_08570 [Bacteroidetes bacterium]|nr:hypothetical protein [Bacteroidota bacterium]
MKTSLIALVFSMMVMAPEISQASDTTCCKDTITTGVEPKLDALPFINPDEPFFFQEKVYIHIYDENETTLIDGAFSREDLQENKLLKDLLRKSARFISIDNHHYYYVEKEQF